MRKSLQCPRITLPPYQYTYFRPGPRIVCLVTRNVEVWHASEQEQEPWGSVVRPIYILPCVYQRDIQIRKRANNQREAETRNMETKRRPRMRQAHNALTGKSCCAPPRSHQCASYDLCAVWTSLGGDYLFLLVVQDQEVHQNACWRGHYPNKGVSEISV